ncbi:MAG: hypothetical protein RLY87_955 [Chloroflexota bacterium]
MTGSLLQADVCIYGAGLGGIAAAYVLLEQGKSVVLVEPTAWIGGQMTSQGVSALDEHAFIEQHPGTSSYGKLRSDIRTTSARMHGITGYDPAHFNPGNGWVSRLCFEPRHALAVLEAKLAPWLASGRCRLFCSTLLESVQRRGSRIQSMSFGKQDGGTIICEAAYVIDASELGDVLVAAQLATVCGAESFDDTQESHAPAEARPNEIQGFTYGFAVSFVPDSHNVIPKPEGYEELRDSQPFSLTLTGSDGTPRPFRVFETGPTGLPPFWTYRRIWDGQLHTPPSADIALINWNSNDYHRSTLIDDDPATQRAINDEAKRLSLAFLYYLQTEVPRDDGSGYGYPELRLLRDVMGTHDGLSMAPYIRESRRTPGMVRITANDILASAVPTARARHWPDSIGIGWYPMDLHPAVGNPRSLYEPTRPFQIPLGALIPPDCDNLICANKNIATTHLSNGSYRLHPVEWSIGTGAGMAVVVAHERTVTLQAVWRSSTGLHEVQSRLLNAGTQLAWATDITVEHDLFLPTQWMLLQEVITHDSKRSQQLDVLPDEALTEGEYTRFCTALLRAGHNTHPVCPISWRAACIMVGSLDIISRTTDRARF